MDTTKTSAGVTSSTRTDAIKSDIDETRQRMDETINELEERLHPRSLVDDALDYVKSSPGRQRTLARDAKRAGRVVAKQVQKHPIPSVLIGAGLTWWLIEQRRQHTHPEYEEEDSDLEVTYSEGGYGPAEVIQEEAYGTEEAGASLKEQAQHAGEQAKSKLAEAGSRVKEAASHVSHKVGEKAQHLKESARAQAHRLRERTSHAVENVKHGLQSGYQRSQERVRQSTEEYPLAMAFGCLALGVLAGLALPRTERENRLMGNAARRASQKARELGGQVVERVTRSVSRELREEGSGEPQGPCEPCGEKPPAPNPPPPGPPPVI